MVCEGTEVNWGSRGEDPVPDHKASPADARGGIDATSEPTWRSSTGGGTGIGAAIARLLAQEGAKVTITRPSSRGLNTL